MLSIRGARLKTPEEEDNRVRFAGGDDAVR
jgi:hypothetical protein